MPDFPQNQVREAEELVENLFRRLGPYWLERYAIKQAIIQTHHHELLPIYSSYGDGATVIGYKAEFRAYRREGADERGPLFETLDDLRLAWAAEQRELAEAKLKLKSARAIAKMEAAAALKEAKRAGRRRQGDFGF